MTVTQTNKKYITPGNHNLPMPTYIELHKSYSGNITQCLFDTEKCSNGIHINSVESSLKFDKKLMNMIRTLRH